MNEALLILLKFGIDTEGGLHQELWTQKLFSAI